MIRIAVIGLGGAGANHARTLAAVEGVRVVRVADTDAQKAKDVAERLGIERWDTDFRPVLADPEVDAVTVATPPSIRSEIILPALAAGKHVLSEKPFAITREEGQRIADAVARSDRKFMVNFGARNLPLFKELKRRLDSGEYGKIEWIWLKYMLPARAGHFVPPEWFWKNRTGGGILVENAGHLIDFINSVTPPVREVSALLGTLEFDRPREGIRTTPDIKDMALLTLRHVGGALTCLANGCVGNGQWGVNADFTTDRCILSIRDTQELRVERDGKVVETEVFKDSWNPIPFAVRQFVDYLRGDVDRVAGVAEGMAALEIALAANESEATGRRVAVRAPGGGEGRA